MWSCTFQLKAKKKMKKKANLYENYIGAIRNDRPKLWLPCFVLQNVVKQYLKAFWNNYMTSGSAPPPPAPNSFHTNCKICCPMWTWVSLQVVIRPLLWKLALAPQFWYITSWIETYRVSQKRYGVENCKNISGVSKTKKVRCRKLQFYEWCMQ